MAEYTEHNIQSLDWREHIRLRPGMYIGKLGDGSAADDGIYVLLKEIVDNAIDEYQMGSGKEIHVELDGESVAVRDFGRGIPLGKVVECVSKMNTGGKYDSRAFKKSVGLNGVGTKVVNALSSGFLVQSFRDGECKVASFRAGIVHKDERVKKSSEPAGTRISFTPDKAIFGSFSYNAEFMEEMLWNYAFLNPGLTLLLNGTAFRSKNGLKDLLARKCDVDSLRYPIVHVVDDDVEIAFSHTNNFGEDHCSFVNGQQTTMGGTHLAAFREAFVKSIKDVFRKDYDPVDIRSGILAAVSVRVVEPVFESQTKTKLGSQHREPNGATIRAWMGDFMAKKLEPALHRAPDIAKAIQEKILQNERERKEIAGIKKLANDRAKKASVFNRKLRDCRVHLPTEHERRLDSTLFITEGDSASGSITKARDPMTQAVFSLRGKPMNCYGLTKRVVYENEEFALLQHALDIESGIQNLRYNRIVIATDADVDGMHIRLLLLTFFLHFFPEIARNRHLFVLQTPLFRVRNKAKTIYCYSESEKVQALGTLGKNAEVTRFKGLGEISPDEFGLFIGARARLDPVRLNSETKIAAILRYYMGKNTQERQDFIIDNLVVEFDDASTLVAEAEGTTGHV